MPPRHPSSRPSPSPTDAGPGNPPRQSPPPATPLNTRSPKMSPAEDAPGSGHSGEDPLVESGLPDHDPEQPRRSDGDEPME